MTDAELAAIRERLESANPIDTSIQVIVPVFNVEDTTEGRASLLILNCQN